MEIKKEYNFYDLLDDCWSGAISTLEKIQEEGKGNELIDFLESMFVDIPTMTDVNDLLWFESDFIFENLGIESEE